MLQTAWTVPERSAASAGWSSSMTSKPRSSIDSESGCGKLSCTRSDHVVDELRRGSRPAQIIRYAHHAAGGRLVIERFR
jgi:hypothetical protein